MLYQISNGAVELGAELILKKVNFEIRDTEKIAVVGGRDEPNELASPCGVCRQVMAELLNHNTVVYLTNLKNDETITYRNNVEKSINTANRINKNVKKKRCADMRMWNTSSKVFSFSTETLYFIFIL